MHDVQSLMADAREERDEVRLPRKSHKQRRARCCHQSRTDGERRRPVSAMTAIIGSDCESQNAEEQDAEHEKNQEAA